MDFISEGYKVKGATVIKNLEKRNMEGYYCETVEEAVEKAMSMIKQDDIVGWGGSTTIDEIGLFRSVSLNKLYYFGVCILGRIMVGKIGFVQGVSAGHTYHVRRIPSIRSANGAGDSQFTGLFDQRSNFLVVPRHV